MLEYNGSLWMTKQAPQKQVNWLGAIAPKDNIVFTD